jgi:signal transduction histidine kinase
MITSLEKKPNHFQQRISPVIYVSVFIFALAHFIIWVFIPELKDFSARSMKINTTLGFMISAIVLRNLRQKNFNQPLSLILSGIIALLGLYTLGEYYLSFPSWPDEFFITDFRNEESSLFPGRMSPIAAILFSLTGLGFLLKSSGHRASTETGVYFFIPVFSIAFLTLLGYLYGLEALYSYGPFIRISWQSSIAFLFLSIGVFFLRERGVTTVLTSQGPGGLIARRLLPTITILPVVLGYGWLIVRRNDWVSREQAIAFYVLAMVSALVVVISTIARKLDLLESERKAIEDKESLTREKFQAVMSTAPLIVWAIDLEGKFTLCEGGGLVDINLSGKDILGQDFYAFNKDNPQVISYIQRALSGEQFFAESTFQNHFHNSNYSPLRDPSGNIIGVSVVTFDVTDLKLAQSGYQMERVNLRHLFKETPEIFGILHGKEFVYEYANEALKKFYGFDPTGKSVAHARPEAQGAMKLLHTVFETGQTVHLSEMEAVFDGRVGYFNMTYAARKDEEGKIDGIMFLGMDVTEQVVTRKDLQKAVAARDEFLSIASHELKTPITSFLLQLQLLERLKGRNDKRTYEEPRINSLIDLGIKQLARINRLVDDMLDIARINTGRLSFRKEPTPLNEILNDVIARMNFLFEKEGIPLTSEDLPVVHAFVDRIRIEQVITNVLTNALRYGNKQPVTVSLSQEGESAVIIITDKGIGMAPEVLGKIFNRFERGVDLNEVSGLGLGLFISRQIVGGHAGKIEAFSEGRGLGTSIRITLPIKETNSEAP